VVKDREIWFELDSDLVLEKAEKVLGGKVILKSHFSSFLFVPLLSRKRFDISFQMLTPSYLNLNRNIIRT